MKGLSERCSELKPYIWGMSELVGCPFTIHPILQTSCMNHIHHLVSVLPLCRLSPFHVNFLFCLCHSSTCGSLGNPLTSQCFSYSKLELLIARTPSIALDILLDLNMFLILHQTRTFLHMKSSPNDNKQKLCHESFNPSIINMNVLASLPFRLQGQQEFLGFQLGCFSNPFVLRFSRPLNYILTISFLHYQIEK